MPHSSRCFLLPYGPPIRATLFRIVRIHPLFFFFAATGLAQLQIATSSVPVATQYQSYSTTLTASGGTPPYTWSVVTSTGVGLPEGMNLDASTGEISAAQVFGQGGYQVTIQVSDSASPTPNTASAALNFGVNSDTSLGGCQMFPPDSIYNQRIDQLPADSNPTHQIPASSLTRPLHPDFGHGFYPSPGGIPWMRVPANQPPTNVNIPGGGQTDAGGIYSWPFPPYPDAVVEGTSAGPNGDDHHILILQSSVNDIGGPQTGPCTLYETYQNTAVPNMFDPATNTWLLSAGAHYVLNSDEIAASSGSLDQGGQDSPGIPMAPLLLRYSEVPMLAQHPLRITMSSPTNGFVWPATGCCGGSGPPQGLLYRLKASVNWQTTCPAATYPQAATVLQALQQYGAYMSDHGTPGYIQGVPDVRWADLDLACIKQFHLSDLEVGAAPRWKFPPSADRRGPTLCRRLCRPPRWARRTAQLFRWSAETLRRVNSQCPPAHCRRVSRSDPAAGTITGAVGASAASTYILSIVATDTASGKSSKPQSFTLPISGGNSLVSISSLMNSASFTGGAIAPGELVTIQGEMLGPSAGLGFFTNPIATSLGGTKVTFGASQAPLLYASATQINAIVPWDVGGQSAVTMVIASAAGSTSLNVAVANAAPGVFTLNSTGTGQAIAVNQDGTMNGPTNAATAGSYISVYFTGGGVTDPPGLTGSVNDDVVTTLMATSTATAGGVAGTVTFAGSAPGFVGGVNQIKHSAIAPTPLREACRW